MTDRNLHSYYETSNGLTITEPGDMGQKTDSPDWSDTLKYTSGLTDFTHHLGIVYGGKEDCADINNRCHHVSLLADHWVSQGLYVFTVKGGSSLIYLSGHIIRGGTRADVVIGDKSDQSSEPTTDVTLNLTKSDGPVRVRVLNGTKPSLTPNSGPYVYLWPHPDGLFHRFWSWLYTRF